MKTIDDALAFADTFDKPANKHMSIVMLAADHRPPESLATRLDAAVAALRAEVLEGGE